MEGSGFDLHRDGTPQCGANCSVVDWANKGSYSTNLYTAAAVDVVRLHAASKSTQPLFLYLAYQAVHSPDEVPEQYVEPYVGRIADPKRRTFAGMLSAMDEGVGNVTAALEEAGIANNTLILFLA